MLLGTVLLVVLQMHGQTDQTGKLRPNYNEMRKHQWFLDLSMGYIFDISPTRQINHEIYTRQGKFLSMFTVRERYFFRERLGVQVEANGSFTANYAGISSVEQHDGRITVNSMMDITTSLLAGVVYRMPIKRWALMPFVNIGWSTFGSLPQSDHYKVVGQNDTRTFEFHLYNRSGFALNPGISLRTRGVIYFDISYLMHPFNIDGWYLTRSVYNGQTDEETFRLTPNNYLMLKFGLSLRLKR
ncbi:MAG: hypothetical protein LBM06_07875 [Prevotellaceae bacterium]|jgi:hypothetical protein|nr:hypothetical protein [Prevotellaceae bacterium]